LCAVLAGAFIFENPAHDCCGKDCPVCLQIEAAQRLLKGFARPGGSGALFAGFTAGHTEPAARFADAQFAPLRTPVTLKTKITC